MYWVVECPGGFHTKNWLNFWKVSSRVNQITVVLPYYFYYIYYCKINSVNSSESNPLASPGRSLTEWVMLQPFPEAPAHTWNHMPHVRGAAEQPLLQTISGTTINDGLPCLYKLLDKSETTLIKLLRTVCQSESDHGSTTRLDSQDISIAHVQCTEWLSVQGGSTPKIDKTFENCLAGWIRSR